MFYARFSLILPVTGKLPVKMPAPACNYDTKLCTAPCIGAIKQEEYRQLIDDLCKFLDGRTQPIVNRLHEEMEKASEELRF